MFDCVHTTRNALAGFATLMLFAMAAQDGPPLVLGGGDLDIAKSESPGCSTDPDEIVVCGDNDPNRYRLPKIGPHYVEQPVRAATRWVPARSVETDQRALPRGGGPAAMVRFRIPLGKGKK
ncbi:hypothetical protein [Sphingomonas sp. UNC305MFCol5.2]|uniref:hypothetical protein n=1 Tax=Sphingomonas sp. UNC305MFCol5.2 TaxID=1449076 RepID=UPI0012DCBC18|nr:hypothetical protein [Sphingomonas sp. UNC305MFCol5.2]